MTVFTGQPRPATACGSLQTGKISKIFWMFPIKMLPSCSNTFFFKFQQRAVAEWLHFTVCVCAHVCVGGCQARSQHSRGSLKLAIKRTASDFLTNTLQALMCGSTTPEKKHCCNYIGPTVGAAVSSPLCANIKTCQTVQKRKEPFGIKSLNQLSGFWCH